MRAIVLYTANYDIHLRISLIHAATALYYRSNLIQVTTTLMCLSIGTPKDNKFSICPKWKIHYFQVSQILARVQPQYNVLEYLSILFFYSIP